MKKENIKMRPECKDCKLSSEDMLNCEVVDLLTEEQLNNKKLPCNRRGKWKDVSNYYSRADGRVKSDKPNNNEE